MATTTKVFNMAGGKHSAEAYSSFEGLLYGSCVADGFVVTKSSSNMNCSIAAGAGLIKVGTTYARRVAIEGDPLAVTVSAASSTLARRDTIVLYVDNSVTPTTSVEDNTNNILKAKVVAGTPAQNPVAPNATTIQSAVGAGNPYIILYDILVPANATNLSTATLYDRRVMAAKALFDALPNGSGDTDFIADSAVTTAKIANGAVTADKIDMASTRTTLWSGSLNTTGSTTYNFSENISNYSYLLITFGQAANCKKTEIFPTDSISQINAVMMQSPSVYVCATIGIVNSGAGFQYTQKSTSGWGNCYIYKIEGIK